MYSSAVSLTSCATRCSHGLHLKLKSLKTDTLFTSKLGLFLNTVLNWNLKEFYQKKSSLSHLWQKKKDFGLSCCPVFASSLFFYFWWSSHHWLAHVWMCNECALRDDSGWTALPKVVATRSSRPERKVGILERNCCVVGF